MRDREEMRDEADALQSLADGIAELTPAFDALRARFGSEPKIDGCDRVWLESMNILWEGND